MYYMSYHIYDLYKYIYFFKISICLNLTKFSWKLIIFYTIRNKWCKRLRNDFNWWTPTGSSSLWPLIALPCPIDSFCLNGGTCKYYEAVGELVCQWVSSSPPLILWWQCPSTTRPAVTTRINNQTVTRTGYQPIRVTLVITWPSFCRIWILTRVSYLTRFKFDLIWRKTVKRTFSTRIHRSRRLSSRLAATRPSFSAW